MKTLFPLSRLLPAASCFLVAGLDADGAPIPTAVDMDASEGCINRITREFDAEENRMHAKALDSGFSFEQFRRMWITFRATQECPLLDE